MKRPSYRRAADARVRRTACQPQSGPQPPSITVTGESLVYDKPDKILLSLGIQTNKPQLLPAKNKSTEIWTKAAAALKEMGIAGKDIQTEYLSIEPRYKNYNEFDETIGYITRNMFVVTLFDPAKVESLITRMLEAGVNRVNGVEFQTTEFKRHRETTRELALKAAHEKADKMAAVLGCTVGKPTAINEEYNGGSWSWYYSSWNGWGYGRSSGGMSQNVVQDNRGSSGGEDPHSMPLGKISVRASVTVTFELK